MVRHECETVSATVRITPLGDVPVKQPRVRDRRAAGEREMLQSSILPPYLRKTKDVEELLP